MAQRAGCSESTPTILAALLRWGGRGLLATAGIGSLACGGLSASSPSLKPVYFAHQEEAGSVQVGVQSVAPFEQYVDSLQPRFSLTEQAAFDMAITQSQIEDLREMRALLARIAVAFPSTTKSVEEVLKRTNAGEESSRTETKTEAPAAAPVLGAPAIDSALGTVPAAPTGNVAIDASLRYRAAAALFQDVALLSTYVRDAAVGPNTVPFIVRLLVTVLPSARLAPYDAYATVSFFLGTKGSPTSYLDEDSPTDWSCAVKADFACNGNEVQVIPLFVTDNLESTATSSARESVRGFESSAGGLVANIGAGAGVSSKGDAFLGIRGVDLGGIQTLAVTSRNTIQARLGAANGEGGYRAVPRTYNLTALVVVPSRLIRPACATGEGEAPPSQRRVLGCDNLRFSAQASFREARSGTLLPLRPKAEFARSLDSLLRTELGIGQGVDLTAAVDRAQALDYDSFSSFLESQSGKHPSSVPALWPAIANLVNSRGVSSGSFPLSKSSVRFFDSPSPKDPKVPIFDDGKSAHVTLIGARELDAKSLSARMVIDVQGSPIYLNSSDIKVTPDLRGVVVTFPSMRALADKLDKKKSTDLPKASLLRLDYAPSTQRWSSGPDNAIYLWEARDCPIFFTKEEEKAKPLPEFEIRSTASFILAHRDGTGEVALEIKKTGKTPRKVYFRVAGGIITKVEPAVLPAGAFHVGDTDQTYVLSLKNLLAGETVTVSAWRLEGEAAVNAPDVALLVVPEADAPSPGRAAQPGRSTL